MVCDHARIETWALTLSRVELQPLWLGEEAACRGVVQDLRLRHPFCLKNLVHVTRILRLGLGFWSFMEMELLTRR
jgi:hypothetical protein